MNNNGTDRDIALDILDTLSSCDSLLSTIESNLYAPHIIAQPVDYVGSYNDTATFTVSAANIGSYQWQTKQNEADEWHDNSATGYNTNTLSVKFLEERIDYSFRCKLTGLDGTVIYTNAVTWSVEE